MFLFYQLMTLNHATWCVLIKHITCLETNAACRFLVNCDVEEARRVWHGRKTPDKPCIYPCEQNGDGVVCKHVKKIEERRASLWVCLVTVNLMINLTS